MGEVRGRGMMKKTVDEAFNDFVDWRLHIIRALIEDSKSFHKTTVVELKSHNIPFINRSIKLWEVKLDDELIGKLPHSTMHLNFISATMIESDWLIKFTVHCDAWLFSIALNSYGFSKVDRASLFEKINKLPSIHDVVCRNVAQTKVKVNSPEAGDEDEESNEDDVVCDACHNYASCVFWIWCGTCKEDTLRCYCNSCSDDPEKDICKSCSNCTVVVRRSDKFHSLCD